MTITATAPPDLPVRTAALETVTMDLYRDIHKGIRNELFAITYAAGRVDPADGDAVIGLGERWRAAVRLLVNHAEHEDRFVQPLIEVAAPELAAVIAHDHPEIEEKLVALELLAEEASGAAAAQRRITSHRFYLGLASFTAEYLEHQALEEVQVGVALAAAYPFEELLAVHQAIVGSIPPAEMMETFQFMIPAMNLDDRTELLGGMQAGAPPQVFDAVIGLVRSVLDPSDFAALAARLDVG
jgi:hypothetical protein